MQVVRMLFSNQREFINTVAINDYRQSGKTFQKRMVFHVISLVNFTRVCVSMTEFLAFSILECSRCCLKEDGGSEIT